MCDTGKLPILSPRAWSWGSGRGEFSLGLLPPTDINSLLMDVSYDDMCDMLGMAEECDMRIKSECDMFSSDLVMGECASNSEYSAEGLQCSTNLSTTAENRRVAIEKWKVKKSRKKGLVQVCKARSDVALSRPRVKGKFIKKAQFISITDLQGY